MRRPIHFLPLALLGAAWGLLLPPPLTADQRVDTTREASPRIQLSVENLAGSVRVEGWDREEVSITGTLDDDVEELTVSGDRDRLEIVVELPNRTRYHHGSADLEIRMPVGGRLSVETVSASIFAAGIEGPVELESVSGSLEVRGDIREVELETVSGRVTAEGEIGRVDAESVSGSVELRGVRGVVEASSVSGNVSVEGGQLERGTFESVSGSVEFRGALHPTGRLEVSSHSGQVVLVLPGDLSATFRVSTFSGDIDSDFGPPPRRTSRYAPGQELEFTTGGGSARVSVESFSGRVRLTKAP